MFAEFKKFALRGNVIDLAIGVIIGGAFGTIVTSLVNDVVMPPIGVLLSVSQAQDFQDWCLPLNARDADEFKQAQSMAWVKQANERASDAASKAEKAGQPKPEGNHQIVTLNYGRFVNNVISFLIISFSVFLVVRQINRIAPPPPPQTRECPECRSMISRKAKRCPNCTSELTPLDV